MTTGRFATRAELVAWIWHAWQHTPACQADIAGSAPRRWLIF